MKFTWEIEDLKSGRKWGVLATREEEMVIVQYKRLTSLRDGHTWEYDSLEDQLENMNKYKYVPVLAPVNASVLIGKAMDNNFNYLRD